MRLKIKRMKSIKEKAEELFDFPYIQDTFEEGANYVLEEIESILEDKELDVEETYDKIYATIKELKK